MVDALASGASVPRDVEVQVLSRVPIKMSQVVKPGTFLLALRERGLEPRVENCQWQFEFSLLGLEWRACPNESK